MKLEKRGKLSAEEAAAAEAAQETAQAEQTAGRKKPVLLYLVILFAIALFLILFSFLVQNRVNAMEMQEMQAEVDAARELQVKYEQSQAENASLRAQLEEANALAAEESRVRQALELVWQLERYYVSGDNEACRAVLEQLRSDDLYLALPTESEGEGESDFESPRAAYDRIAAELDGGET